MELGFVRKGKECLWAGEYGLLWTERSYLGAGRVYLQAKRGFLYELGMEITRMIENLRKVSMCW